MATEYKDGTFGETLPLDEAMQEFAQACHNGTAKSLHVGTYDEIEMEKAKQDFQRDLQKSLKELEVRVGELEKDDDSLIEKPTVSEMKKVLQEWQK